jgi:hypothetical protein
MRNCGGSNSRTRAGVPARLVCAKGVTDAMRERAERARRESG